MDYYKFKIDESKMEEIRDFYNAELIESSKRPYDVFDITTYDKVHIACYRSKNQYTIVFSGEKDAVKSEVEIFFKNAIKITQSENTINGEWEDNSFQIGSDEVGIGDFFLGFYICACYLDNQDIQFIDSLGVKDSKKLSDSKIEEIAPILLKRIKKHAICISPTKLDEYKAKHFSTHFILAKALNFCHEELIKKYKLSSDIPIYIDQFEMENNYIKYANPRLKNPLIFKTKGESFYPSIATSSCLARYFFLEDWKKMNEHYNMEIPKGASSEVDKTYKALVKKYGQQEVDPYVKHFFRNYKLDS